jgi:hypothetical protein
MAQSMKSSPAGHSKGSTAARLSASLSPSRWRRGARDSGARHGAQRHHVGRRLQLVDLGGVSHCFRGRLFYLYQPGADDGSREWAIKNSLDAAGIAGTGGFAASRLVGDAGSLGTFIGGIGARNLERAGRRTGQQALEMARRMEAQGASPEQIRAATNRLIESGDPLLGGVKGP